LYLKGSFKYIVSEFCSKIGATVTSIGFYTVMWGKATEEIEEDVGSLESPTTENVPIFQIHVIESCSV